MNGWLPNYELRFDPRVKKQTPRVSFAVQLKFGFFMYLKQGFAPADDLLLFRQKEAKPFLPVRGTTGNCSTAPNPDGSETRCEVQSHLSTQTVFAER